MTKDKAVKGYIEHNLVYSGVGIRPDQFVFLKKHNIVLSKLVRDAIDKVMAEYKEGL